MEELVFKFGQKSISFRATPGTILPWPVPRTGERVQVRGTGDGQSRSFDGVVEDVSYYYSTGNNGPVVIVVLV